MSEQESAEILKCRLTSDQRYAKMELEIQKVKDDVKSMEDRLTKQELMTNEIHDLSKSVSELATNMSNMIQEQKKQGERLDTLEQKPIRRADQILDTIIKVVLTAVASVVLVKIGLA